MKLPIAENVNMGSYLLTTLPEMVMRTDKRLLPWIYENYVNIFSDSRGHLMYAGVSLWSTLAKAKPFIYSCFPQNTQEPTKIDIVDFFKKQIMEAGCYIYTFLEESQLNTFSNKHNKAHIHDSLLYGYDQARDVFYAVAQDGYHTKKMEYASTDLEAAYWAAYKFSSHKSQSVAFKISEFLPGEYPFSLDIFLAELNNYINSSHDKKINYFAGQNAHNIVLGKEANLHYLNLLSADRPFSFVEFRTMNFINEHRHGLLERFEFVFETYDFSQLDQQFLIQYREIVHEYDLLRMMALKNMLKYSKNHILTFKENFIKTFEKENCILEKLFAVLGKGVKKDPRYIQKRADIKNVTVQQVPSDREEYDCAAIAQVEFTNIANVNSVRITQRKLILLYSDEGLIGQQYCAIDSAHQMITFDFPICKTNSLKFQIYSDFPIDEKNLNIQIGCISYAYEKTAYSSTCWDDCATDMYVARNVLSYSDDVFWDASPNWVQGEELIVDLETERDISCVRITERNGCSRICCFSVYISSSDYIWKPVIVERQGLWRGIPETIQCSINDVRYIKLVFHETIADPPGYDEPGIALVEVY